MLDKCDLLWYNVVKKVPKTEIPEDETMNRTMHMPANYSVSRTARHSFADWAELILLCLCWFFSQREVKTVMRIAFGGGAFMVMLGIAGGIECGTVALLPGGLLCLALAALSFLILRGLSEEV